MKKRSAFVFTVMMLVFALGCTGTMDGVIRQDAARFQITYTDTRIAAAELITVLPDGEHFRGKPEKFNMAGDMTSAAAGGSGDTSASFPGLQTFPGNAKATLSGDKGSKMACRFKLTDVIIGFSSGGFGLCQMSDGRIIDVFF